MHPEGLQTSFYIVATDRIGRVNRSEHLECRVIQFSMEQLTGGVSGAIERLTPILDTGT
jgi:hypothetical protein